MAKTTKQIVRASRYILSSREISWSYCQSFCWVPPQNPIFKRHLSIHTWNIYIISTTCRARKGSQHCSIRHFLMCCRRCKGKRIGICTNLKNIIKIWVKRLKSTYFLSSYYLRNIECSKIQLPVEYTQYNLEGKNKCIKSCTFEN